MSDIEFRVDKAFSSAVEEQLAEQRAIKRLVARVDESLVALSDGLVDVSGHIDAVGDRIGGAGVTPDDLSTMQHQLAEHIDGVSRHLSDVEAQLAERTGDESLIVTISETRADLLDALARLERSSQPVAEAVEASRQDVVTALRRISEVIASDRDHQWEQAVDRLDDAIRRLGDGQQDQLALAESTLATQQDQAEKALKVMEARARAAFEEMIASLATDQDDLVSKVGQIAGDVDIRNDEIAEKLAEVKAASVDVAPQVQAVLGGIAERLTDLLAAQKGEATEVVTLLGEVRSSAERGEGRMDALADALAGRLEGLAADRLAQMQENAEESARRTEASVEHAVTAIVTGSERGAERMGSLGVTVAARLEEMTEGRLQELQETSVRTSAEVREASEVLIEAAAAIRPVLQVALGELTAALLTRTDGDREEVDAAVNRLSEAAAEARESVLGAVGHATERLSEAQADGIGRLMAVTDDLGRLPEAIEPPVLQAVQHLRAAVAEAVADLQTTTSGAARDAQSALQDAVRLSESATESLSALATGLEPAVRAALTEVQTTLLATSAADRDRAERSISVISDASQAAADGVRASTTDATRAFSASADAATTRLVMAQADGVEALSEAADRLDTASGEIPQVMGEVRTGLVEALTAAQGDITTLLTRADEVTDRRVGAMFSRASTVMAEQLDEHEQAMVARTRELVDATDRVTPAVDALVQRLKGEVASVATTVMADLGAPIEEAGRVAEAMAPALQEVLTDFREELASEIVASQSRAADIGHQMATAAASLEQTGAQFVPTAESLMTALVSAVDGVAERTAGAASLGVGESREVMLRTIEELRTDLTGQIEEAMSAARRSALLVEAAQADGVETMKVAADSTREALETTSARGTEDLRAAAAAIGEVVGRLEPGVAAIVEDLRSNLLAEAVAERTRADASIILLREDVAETVAALQAELATTRDTSSGAVADLGERADRARSAMEEGAQAVHQELTAAMDGHRNIIAAVETAAETFAGSTAQASAAADGLAADAEATRGQVASMVEHLRKEVTGTLEHAVETIRQQARILSEQMRSIGGAEDQVAARVSDEVDRLISGVSEQVGNLALVLDQTKSHKADRAEAEGAQIAAAVDQVQQTLAAQSEVLTGAVDQATERDRDRDADAVARFERLEEMMSTVAGTVSEIRSEIAAAEASRRERPAPPTLFDVTESPIPALLDAMESRVLEAVATRPTAPPPVVTEAIDTAAVQRTVDSAVQQAAHVGQTRLDAVLARLDIAVDRMAVDEDRKATSARRTEQIVSDLQRSVVEGQSEIRVLVSTLADQVATTGPPDAEAQTTCVDCGFVARTPAGLLAHARTCTEGS